MLSSDILGKATSIVYYEDTGSLPPEYEYAYTITVTKKDVHFVLKRAYGERTPYDEKIQISDAQYQKFIAKLVSQKIRKGNAVAMPGMDGSNNISIKVKKGDSILFSGTADDGLIATNGNLKDAFTQLLRTNMRRNLKKLK